MKITKKHLTFASRLTFIAGICISVLSNIHNDKYPDDPHRYGFYIGIGLLIVSMIFMMPWIKDEDDK